MATCVCNTSSILLLPCVMVYYIVSVLFVLSFWCPCMAINVVSVQYNGGFSSTLYTVDLMLFPSGNPFKMP